MFQYWLITLKESDLWSFVLTHLQIALNNLTKYSLIRLSLNQIIFSMWMYKVMNLLWVEKLNTEWIDFNYNEEQMKRKLVTLTMMNQYWSAHIDVKDAIAYVIITIKYYYNWKHKLLYFKIRDLVNLHLHKSYMLFSLREKNKKLRQQFMSLLKVLNCVRKLAYQLELSLSWHIHDVISVAHLKLTHINDSYQQSRSEEPEEVIVNDEKKWEVEKLLFKRIY